jgi:hypothetical protein
MLVRLPLRRVTATEFLIGALPGASVGKYTILGTTGNEWELAHDDGTPKNMTKD